MKTIFKYLLLSAALIALSGCDTYDYKRNIQEEYDDNNESGHEAICVSSGFLSPSELPYTIHYLDELNGTEDRQEKARKRDNLRRIQRLHYFAGHGLLTEELVGEQEGKPLYRYDLTDEGKERVLWFARMMTFCFGRIVVDSIRETKDIGKGTRRVYITYHVENIPDWIKEPEIYRQFKLSDELIRGESVYGNHSYNIRSDGTLHSRGGVNGVVIP